MKRNARVFKREEGLSLIELFVVVAIIAILATLTAVAVTGPATSTKDTSKTADEKMITDGNSTYSGEHPQGRSPTLDGCLPGKSLIVATKTCSTGGVGGTISAQQFAISETAVDVDLNDDGDATDTALVNVVPILWDQFFTSAATTKAFTEFVELPAHDFDLVGTVAGWKTGSTADRPETTAVDSIAAPTSIETGDKSTTYTATDKCPTDAAKCPVWVMLAGGDAIALLPSGSY